MMFFKMCLVFITGVFKYILDMSMETNLYERSVRFPLRLVLIV
jgi:hypothetical protein